MLTFAALSAYPPSLPEVAAEGSLREVGYLRPSLAEDTGVQWCNPNRSKLPRGDSPQAREALWARHGSQRGVLLPRANPCEREVRTLRGLVRQLATIFLANPLWGQSSSPENPYTLDALGVLGAASDRDRNDNN